MTHSVLDPAGIQAARIDGLWWLLLGVCTAVYVLVILALARAVFGRRPAGSPERVERRVTIAVTAATATTAAILLALIVASALTSRALASLATDKGLSVELTGHQWWWEVTYEDPTPSRRVTTANELHVPVGVPVLLKLTSRDVIHSFWAPSLHGKTDLIPGLVTTTWIRADRPGVHRGLCAEFCGVQHAHMDFVVVAEPRDRFDAWLARERAPAPEPATDEQARGRDVFLHAPCAMCHAVRGTPAAGTVAPDLTHVASRRTLAAGTLPNGPGALAGWLLDPQRVKPGNHMPPSALSADELTPLLAWLGSLG